MRQLPIIITGTVLFTLASTAYSQASMQSGNQTAPTATTAPANSQSSQTQKIGTAMVPSSIQWANAPDILPAGAQYAILEGNPKSKGNFTIRVKLPNNYQIKPAYNQNLERVTVLSGTVNVGKGDKFDTNSGTALPAGSFIVVPAKQHHYLWATEDSIIQISGSGPWVFKYVNPADNPKNAGTNTQPQKQDGHVPNTSDQLTNSTSPK